MAPPEPQSAEERVVDPMPHGVPVDAEALGTRQRQREHKTRLRARQGDQKRADLVALLGRLGGSCEKLSDDSSPLAQILGAFGRRQPPVSAPRGSSAADQESVPPPPLDPLDSLAAELGPLFVDIDAAQELPADCASAWAAMPACLTPDDAQLDASTAASAGMLQQEEKRQKAYLKKLQAKLKDGDITEEEMENLLQKFGRPAQCDCCDGPSAGGATAFSLMNAERGLRKKQQIANFATLVGEFRREALERQKHQKPEDRRPPTVADFGSGSGNLCLPLAFLFPDLNFVLVDRNVQSLEIARNRARASLPNVCVVEYEFSSEMTASENEAPEIPPFDLGIGLHSCGSFTDMVMALCVERKAQCLVCPCCNGKMGDYLMGKDGSSAKQAGPTPPSIATYPRSQLLRPIFSEEEFLLKIARAADNLDALPAKQLVELDRALWAKEQQQRGITGYSRVDLFRLSPASCTPKNLLVWLR